MYTGKKVGLREYRREDVELKLSYINDPEVVRLIVGDTPYPLTLHEEMKWFESLSGLNDTYKFAVETLEDNKFIADCSINNLDWKNSVATIGICIGNKDYWGGGYGTDVMNILMKFIFMEMNINKIRLTVYSFNERAIRCYEKCGFKVEGVLRQEIYRDGRYYDKVAMGLLKEEYIKNI